MPRGMGLILSGLGLFLVVGLLTIIGAAVRESVVAPGESPEPRRRRRARIAVAISAVLLIAIVLGGRAWWDAEALAYGELVLYRPFASEASMISAPVVYVSMMLGFEKSQSLSLTGRHCHNSIGSVEL